MNIVGHHWMLEKEENKMPEVKDMITGEVISKQPYTEEGADKAEEIANTNPSRNIEYAPGGTYDAGGRVVKEYAGGGKTGFARIGLGEDVANVPFPGQTPSMIQEDDMNAPLPAPAPSMMKKGGKVKKK